MFYAFSESAPKAVPEYLTGLFVHNHFAQGKGWNDLPEKYKALFSELWHPEAYADGIIRQIGWVFDLREFFNEYWVEDKILGIRKIYAPCKSYIREMACYPSGIKLIVQVRAARKEASA